MDKREAFLSESSFGTTMLIAVIDEYGTECISWDPETLRAEINQDFHMDLPKGSMDRIMAAMTLMASDLFFVSIECFNNVCEALNFGPVDGSKFIPCELEDIIWGCTEARLLLGSEEYDNADWSHDVRGYTAMQLSLEGITNAPDILEFAEFDSKELDNKETLLAQDQLMAGTYQSRQESELKILNKEVIFKLQLLLQQIASLKLKNGRTAEISKMLDNITEKIKGADNE